MPLRVWKAALPPLLPSPLDEIDAKILNLTPRLHKIRNSIISVLEPRRAMLFLTGRCPVVVTDSLSQADECAVV